MYDVKEAIEHRFESDMCKRVIYVNNHDECAEINKKFRLADRIWIGHADSYFVRKRYTLAAGILFTSPEFQCFFKAMNF